MVPPLVRLLYVAFTAELLIPLPGAAQEVRSPAPGVLCDAQALRGSGVCYDARGASIPLTGRYLGRRAEAQLANYLTSNPAPLDFRLSNGTVCSVAARTCWLDGWNKRNPDQQLTSQLFNSAQPGPGSARARAPARA